VLAGAAIRAAYPQASEAAQMSNAEFSPAGAARYSGIDLTRIKAYMRSGALPFHKDGRRTVILGPDIDNLRLGLALHQGCSFRVLSRPTAMARIREWVD
jgi:hypothetical protein